MTRSRQKPGGELPVFTPVKAIRVHCLGCSCGSRKEVATCPLFACPLWPYRMGKRPTEAMLHEREAFAAEKTGDAEDETA